MSLLLTSSGSHNFGILQLHTRKSASLGLHDREACNVWNL